MKTYFAFSFAAILGFLLAAGPLRADGPQPAVASPDAAPSPWPMPYGKWCARVELLMVALPEDKALDLLPSLEDEARIDGAYQQLIEGIKRQEMTLTGYPQVVLLEREQAANSESVLEKLYPTRFGPAAVPNNFEKRNMGPTLQVSDLVVSPDGKWIRLYVQARRTALPGFDYYEIDGGQSGTAPKMGQPLFASTMCSDVFAIKNGQRILLGVHKLAEPKGQLELFVLKASATQVH